MIAWYWWVLLIILLGVAVLLNLPKSKPSTASPTTTPASTPAKKKKGENVLTSTVLPFALLALLFVVVFWGVVASLKALGHLAKEAGFGAESDHVRLVLDKRWEMVEPGEQIFFDTPYGIKNFQNSLDAFVGLQREYEVEKGKDVLAPVQDFFGNLGPEQDQSIWAFSNKILQWRFQNGKFVSREVRRIWFNNPQTVPIKVTVWGWWPEERGPR